MSSPHSTGNTKALKHGACLGGHQTREYTSWAHMRTRCNNPEHVDFADYGGRGIRVCDRWKSFENFLADMGPRPPGTSIDRIDNNGSYEPGNCRWATQTEQRLNARNCRMLSFNGKTQTLTAWAREAGIPRTTLRKRLNRGVPLEQALRR